MLTICHTVAPDCRDGNFIDIPSRSGLVGLLNGVSNALPDDTVPEPLVIACRINTEPHKKGFADQVGIGNVAPVTTVVTAISVVTHDKIMIIGHHKGLRPGIRSGS